LRAAHWLREDENGPTDRCGDGGKDDGRETTMPTPMRINIRDIFYRVFRGFEGGFGFADPTAKPNVPHLAAG